MTPPSAPATGRAPDPGDRRGDQVRAMFAAAAPRYDLLNHLLSMNVDRLWRRRVVQALRPRPGERILDLCTGTGDLAFALSAGTGASVVGADFCLPMLRIAARKASKASPPPRWLQADALSLGFPASSFDAVTVAFGVRNFEDVPRGITEIARVLGPGGRLAVLEFSEPKGRLFGPLYRFYFHRVLPAVGNWISGSRGAYSYLPATVDGFPDPPAFGSLLEEAGLEVRSQEPLTGGIATLHLAVKPSKEPAGEAPECGSRG